MSIDDIIVTAFKQLRDNPTTKRTELTWEDEFDVITVLAYRMIENNKEFYSEGSKVGDFIRIDILRRKKVD